MAFLTSVKAAASSFLGSPATGSTAGLGGSAAGTGAASAFACVLSTLSGSGTVAGAGAAGVVVLGAAWAGEATSEVAVGAASVFLGFFLKSPLKAFLTWSMASSAIRKGSDGCPVDLGAS